MSGEPVTVVVINLDDMEDDRGQLMICPGHSEFSPGLFYSTPLPLLTQCDLTPTWNTLKHNERVDTETVNLGIHVSFLQFNLKIENITPRQDCCVREDGRRWAVCSD